jgi:hypothetical protein
MVASSLVIPFPLVACLLELAFVLASLVGLPFFEVVDFPSLVMAWVVAFMVSMAFGLVDVVIIIGGVLLVVCFLCCIPYFV